MFGSLFLRSPKWDISIVVVVVVVVTRIIYLWFVQVCSTKEVKWGACMF